MSNNNRSRKDRFNDAMMVKFRRMVNDGFVFLGTQSFEEIKEEVNVSDDDKSIFITLDRISTDFVLTYKNIVLESDMITAIYNHKSDIITLSFIRSHDATMEPELTVFMDNNEFFYINNEQSNVYEVVVSKKPTHIENMINNIMDLLPIIVTEDHGLQLVNGALSYVTDIKAYLNTVMQLPVIIDQAITPAHKGISTHYTKLNYIISEINNIDANHNNKLVPGSIIVIKEENKDSVYTICEFCDHVMICKDEADGSTTEIPYSMLFNDYSAIIPAYTPVFYNRNGVASTLNDVISEEELDQLKESFDALFNFRSYYGGVSMDKVQELCDKKRSGKRIDTKRNRVINSLKESIAKITSLYREYQNILITFNAGNEIILYEHDIHRIIILNESNIFMDKHSFINILKFLGVKYDE